MSEPTRPVVSLGEIAADEVVKRARSFGGAAREYDRYRPGPPLDAVDWLLPAHVSTVVDLGAGTGALTKLLIGRADEVLAVEPDERMQSVLAREVPGVQPLIGRGESIPAADDSVDAVLASSSWHWMDPVATLGEVERVLVPGGTLGVLWAGPDPDGPFLAQARAMLTQAPSGGTPAPDDAPTNLILGDVGRPSTTLELPPGTPFEEPEHRVTTWDVALNADELIGLLGTFSWILTMPDDTRQRVFDHARQLLRDVLGVAGEVTVDVGFRSDVWRTHHRSSAS